MRQLRQAGDDVADGVDAGFVGLHPLVHLNESALRLDFRRLETDAFSARRAAHGDQNFFGFLLDLFAIGGREGHFHARLLSSRRSPPWRRR